MFMNQVNGFHDSYIVGLSYQSSKYLVSQSSITIASMMCIVFGVNKKEFDKIEMELEGVDRFSINLNLSSSLEIYGVKFEKRNDGFYWYSDADCNEDSSYWFRCQTIRWRVVPYSKQAKQV